MKKNLLTLIGISTLAFTGFLFPLHPQDTFAEADHIVISEIQIAGESSSEDFIELYNPTSVDINLGEMKLVKRTSTGSSDNSIEAFTNTDIIPAHGFYLWCNSSLEEILECDDVSTNTISNNNSVGLRYEPSDTGELVDAVTLGTPDYPLGEGNFLTAPTAGSSIERKANATSTADFMNEGGSDEFLGNGEDTDNNSLDFVTRATPQPQNSASAIEPSLVTPSPTNEPTPTPNPTKEPSPTPTIHPSPSPSTEPSPTITPTNEPTPTVSPIPTLEPTPTIEPTKVPTPTPIKGPRIFSRNPIMTCAVNYKSIQILRRTFYFPLITCFRT